MRLQSSTIEGIRHKSIAQPIKKRPTALQRETREWEDEVLVERSHMCCRRHGNGVQHTSKEVEDAHAGLVQVAAVSAPHACVQRKQSVQTRRAHDNPNVSSEFGTHG